MEGDTDVKCRKSLEETQTVNRPSLAKLKENPWYTHWEIDNYLRILWHGDDVDLEWSLIREKVDCLCEMPLNPLTWRRGDKSKLISWWRGKTPKLQVDAGLMG